ncbi:MAG: hypothetical protein GTO02_18575 [Candidatus Dadabacteria bacterium]|nr:hypothetical protein [Candidatus Dadabacteria bacterium]
MYTTRSKALGNRLIFILSLSIVFSVTAISLAQPPSSVPPVNTGKPTQDVNVTNTETNPVPVTVENADPISTIIENDVSDPVPTFDVDRQRIDPFQEIINFVIPAGSQSGEEVIVTVPEGKRLVIEYVSATITLPNPSVLRSVGVRIPDSFGNTTIHKMPFPQGVLDEFNDETSYSFGAPTKFYAAPGRSVSITANRPRLSNGAIGGEGTVIATISGFLVPCGGDLGPCE